MTHASADPALVTSECQILPHSLILTTSVGKYKIRSSALQNLVNSYLSAHFYQISLQTGIRHAFPDHLDWHKPHEPPPSSLLAPARPWAHAALTCLMVVEARHGERSGKRFDTMPQIGDAGHSLWVLKEEVFEFLELSW